MKAVGLKIQVPPHTSRSTLTLLHPHGGWQGRDGGYGVTFVYWYTARSIPALLYVLYPHRVCQSSVDICIKSKYLSKMQNFRLFGENNLKVEQFQSSKNQMDGIIKLSLQSIKRDSLN